MADQSMYHHIAAVAVIAMSLAAFSVEYKVIETQGLLIDEVKNLADRMREERIASRTQVADETPTPMMPNDLV
ncbi:MAG: hypothetical protein ACKO0V_22730 [bacterium]